MNSCVKFTLTALGDVCQAGIKMWRTYPRTRRDNERLHAGAGVVTLLFAEAGVDDIDDAVNGQGGFCDVSRHHHLGLRGGGEQGADRGSELAGLKRSKTRGTSCCQKTKKLTFFKKYEQQCCYQVSQQQHPLVVNYSME